MAQSIQWCNCDFPYPNHEAKDGYITCKKCGNVMECEFCCGDDPVPATFEHIHYTACYKHINAAINAGY